MLVSSRNPLNIGAAARAMSNFGSSNLRLVTPYKVAFRRAVSAVGAGEVMEAATVYETVGEAVADCALVIGTTAVRNRKLQHPIRRLEDGARLIRRHLPSKRVALLFGSEKFGLSNEDLSHCHWLMRIPTQGNISMNLGQAVAVCLYELIRTTKKETKLPKQDLASMGEVEMITGLLLESLHHSGYVKPGTATVTEEKVRRLMRRLNVPAGDSEVWLGVLRQILWKTRQKTS